MIERRLEICQSDIILKNSSELDIYDSIIFEDFVFAPIGA